ncbi:MAG: PAS domain-containing protein, partial [Spirochaetes bacterium]|nr:PAS domain-containing protein [Spirochaetota bacterium]
SSIEDGLLLVDPDGGVALYNPRAMELLGLGPELFFGRRDDPARGEAAVAEILAACRRVGAAASAEHDSPAAPDSPAAQETLQLETGAGRYLSVRIRAITDKYRSGREFGSLAVIGDVTEFRKLEIQKKDFVANVSHEFRTPLTLISGFIEMFRMGGVIPEADRSRAFEIMDLEAERLKRLVSELLTLSEMESELPFHDEDAIRVAEVLARLAQSLEGLAARKGLSLRVEIGRDLPALYGNENWFYLAVKNLVENAIKYSPGGTGGEVRLAASARDGAVCIEVSDTGIGIAEAELERVFERFYRVEKARGSGRGGSGLGLALVKDVAAMFGGRVSVRSALGKGSEFALTLPVRKSGEENVSGGTHGH